VVGDVNVNVNVGTRIRRTPPATHFFFILHLQVMCAHRTHSLTPPGKNKQDIKSQMLEKEIPTSLICRHFK